MVAVPSMSQDEEQLNTENAKSFLDFVMYKNRTPKLEVIFTRERGLICAKIKQTRDAPCSSKNEQ